MYQAVLEPFRAARSETLALAGAVNDQQASFTPAAGKWSIGEVLDHILLAEKLYRDRFEKLIAMKRAGQKPELRSSFEEINTSVMFIPRPVLPALEVPFRMLNLFLPGAVRETLTRHRIMPAQAPSIAIPRKGRGVEELRKELEESLALTEKLFHSNADLDFREMRLSHPLMGSNNVLQLVRIMTLHEQRHQEQIRAVQRAPGYPANR